MTNEERRQALANARRKAVQHATEAEAHPFIGPGDDREMALANMWANVAQCLKVGGTDAIPTDGPDGFSDIDSQHLLNHGVITR